MTLTPRRMIAATIAADELCAVALALGVRSVKVVGRASCAGFSQRSAAEAAAALQPIADEPGELIFVAPGAWCAVKPAQVTRKEWPAAEAGLRESIEHLFPIEQSDAMLGMVNLYADASPELRAPVGGALIAARRSRLTPAIEALEAALHRRVSRTLAAPMALLALGLQREARSVALDVDAHGQTIAHRLAYGLPVAVDEPAPALDAAADGAEEQAKQTVVALPGVEWAEGVRRISGDRLAAAGALALLNAPGAFVPLAGAPKRAPSPWLAPAAVGVAVALVFVASVQVWAARLESASQRTQAELASLEDSLIRTQGHRREADRQERLLRQGVQATVESWRSPMPLLREVVAALGEEGFYYRIQIEEQSALLRGESPNAGALLQRLDRAPGVAAAEFIAPVSKSTMSGHDVFEIRVRRSGRSGG